MSADPPRSSGAAQTDDSKSKPKGEIKPSSNTLAEEYKSNIPLFNRMIETMEVAEIDLALITAVPGSSGSGFVAKAYFNCDEKTALYSTSADILYAWSYSCPWKTATFDGVMFGTVKILHKSAADIRLTGFEFAVAMAVRSKFSILLHANDKATTMASLRSTLGAQSAEGWRGGSLTLHETQFVMRNPLAVFESSPA